MHGESETEVW